MENDIPHMEIYTLCNSEELEQHGMLAQEGGRLISGEVKNFISDCGGNPDGITDNAAALQRACDFNCTVRFPEGKYLIGCGNYKMQPDSLFIGEGEKSVLFNNSKVGSRIFPHHNESTDQQIKRVCFFGNIGIEIITKEGMTVRMGGDGFDTTQNLKKYIGSGFHINNHHTKKPLNRKQRRARANYYRVKSKLSCRSFVANKTAENGEKNHGV